MIIKCGKVFKILKLVELSKGYREVLCITLLQNNLFGKKNLNIQYYTTLYINYTVIKINK